MLTQEVATTTKWSIDPMHSQIGFKVKHLMFTNVRGHFSEYEASILTEGTDFTSAEVDLQISASSVNTNDGKRDEHLRSADFFDADNFPDIKFRSKSLEQAGSASESILLGDLTLKGITRLVRLRAEFGGVIRDPWGNEKAALSIEGKINRKDWGLNWNAALEAGGLLVGEEVSFEIDIQLFRQA